MSERHMKGYHDTLFWVFALCVLAVTALYFVVRPAELSTDQNVIDAVKAMAAASVAIFLATANQVSNLVPAQRQAFRPFLWGLLLALTMAAAIAVPIVIVAWGYFSDKALILLSALVVIELLLFILLVLSKFEPSPLAEGGHPWSAPAARPAPAEQTQVLPPVQLEPDAVAEYERATLALEEATREQEEATREADELARQYQARLQQQGYE
ncbi:MAG: hypothetical protein ACSLFD_03635 [Solirubrobacterales bacterium]